MSTATLTDINASRGHDAKRRSIVEAAASVFCREGFGGANIDMIAAEAGVSRQTIYNHHGDKETLFTSVLSELTERMNTGMFRVLGTFPENPVDLQAELTAFAVRMFENCVCNRDGKFLRKLIQSEGDRYPELFATWLRDGPARTTSGLAARFARLALQGLLEITDPDVAARQFMALVRADLEPGLTVGMNACGAEVEKSAANGVKAFLRIYGKRHPLSTS